MDPAVLLNLMVEMAGLEEELAQARATLEHHERRDRHLRQLQQEYETDAQEAESAGRDAAVNLRRTEGRIREVEAALAHKRDQVIGITDRRQYRALKEEIRALEAQLDRLEVSGLDILDQVEQKDEGAAEALQDRDRQQVRGAEELDKMRLESDQARAASEEIAEQMVRLTGMLPTAEARHVNRLQDHHDRAVVRVQDGACGGCFGQLPVQQGIDAENGRALIRCPSCARYVVRKSYK